MNERKQVTNKIRDKIKETWPHSISFKIHGNEFQEIMPDLVCCIEGWFFGIESKLPGKQADPRQKEILSRIREAGGEGFTADSTEQAIIFIQRALARHKTKPEGPFCPFETLKKSSINTRKP